MGSLEGVMHFVLSSRQIVVALGQQNQQDENRLAILLNAHNLLLIDEIAPSKQNFAPLSIGEVAFAFPFLAWGNFTTSN